LSVGDCAFGIAVNLTRIRARFAGEPTSARGQPHCVTRSAPSSWGARSCARLEGWGPRRPDL